MAERLNLTIRVSENQLNEIKGFAEYSQSSVGSIIRDACGQHCQKMAYLKINKRIFDNSKTGDTTLLAFPGNWNNEAKNKIKIYIHTAAFSDLKNLGQNVENDVMEFLDSSTRDNSILHKGQITTTDDGVNFICFRVNLVKVYCHFSPMQITVLSVVK